MAISSVVLVSLCDKDLILSLWITVEFSYRALDKSGHQPLTFVKLIGQKPGYIARPGLKLKEKLMEAKKYIGKVLSDGHLSLPKDTAKNIEAMRAEIIVIRHTCAGAAQFLAEHFNIGPGYLQ